MVDKEPKAVDQESRTLTDDQIVTQRKLSRRSFLTATGALLVGAAAVASGVRAAAQQASDPDKKKASDPDQKNKKKGGDPDKKKVGSKAKAKPAPKASDPDHGRR